LVLAKGAVADALMALTSTGSKSVVSSCCARAATEEQKQIRNAILFILMKFLK
jgi:hypothetical protein